jgi:hypothetical protein
LVIDFVVEFLQEHTQPVDPNLKDSPLFSFRGGSTVILDDRGQVRYVIEKSIGNETRLRRQRDFLLTEAGRSRFANYLPPEIPEKINLQITHRGS